MRIAFYAPMKPPDHPVPSGDRLMARLLISALEMAGNTVEVASRLRTFASEPAALPPTTEEVNRIRANWRGSTKPDLWFCYHPYYKAPDPIGPTLCREFAIPYVTAEASYAAKRDAGPWASRQLLVADAVRLARVNISFTGRDREGLLQIAPRKTCILLCPFIDPSPFVIPGNHFATGKKQEINTDAAKARLVTVAMMRAGDKFKSYEFLAQALALIADEPWHLTVIGDGPLRSKVTELFANFAAGRVEFMGERQPEEIPGLLAACDIYVWPGCGEAYGLAYLEAQAAGLPVIAEATAGVPAVVKNGETGCLTTEGDIAAYAKAIHRLTNNPTERRRLSASARRFAHEERSLAAASAQLAGILDKALRASP
jgi:glycosyltransferase involved in cell wall biosynthesis